MTSISLEHAVSDHATNLTSLQPQEPVISTSNGLIRTFHLFLNPPLELQTLNWKIALEAEESLRKHLQKRYHEVILPYHEFGGKTGNLSEYVGHRFRVEDVC